MDGVSHTVEVTAATLYEAVAQGLAAIRGNEWVAGIAQGLNTVKVSVADVRVEHKVKLIDFTNGWIGRVARRERLMTVNVFGRSWGCRFHDRIETLKSSGSKMSIILRYEEHTKRLANVAVLIRFTMGAIDRLERDLPNDENYIRAKEGVVEGFGRV